MNLMHSLQTQGRLDSDASFINDTRERRGVVLSDVMLDVRKFHAS